MGYRMKFTARDIELLQQANEYLREFRNDKEHDPILNYIIEDLDGIVYMFFDGDE